MITLEYQLMIAVGLDLLLGDPSWYPHPVRLIGKLALVLEKFSRRWISPPFWSGCFTFFMVISITGGVTGGGLYLAYQISPILGDLISIFLLYTSVAIRDLMQHSFKVYQALKRENIEEARKRVGYLVGRDTEKLEEKEIVRATVESIAENLVDGITAPLIFAFLGGPVGAMVYKSINTLDSMFGYRNERYEKFGWMSAKVDDVVNFIPARVTALFIPIAAIFLRLHPMESLRILLRDRKKNPSPNAGHTEAAMAGALAVRLGGLNFYLGRPSEKPYLGEDVTPLQRTHILQANGLILIASLFILGGLLLIGFMGYWDLSLTPNECGLPLQNDQEALYLA